MELKYGFLFWHCPKEKRSNRTFMELKWRWLNNFLHTFLSSNRTFMELKLPVRYRLKTAYAAF